MLLDDMNYKLTRARWFVNITWNGNYTEKKNTI